MASARGIRAGAAYIELFLNDSKLVRGLQNAGKKLKAFGDAITGWGQKMATIGAAITAPLLGSAKAFSEMGDRIAKASARTGISVETLSELAYAADLSGANLETLEGSIRKMQKAIVEAAEGSESANDALSTLGLTVEDLRGLSPDQQFKLIADRLAQIQSPAMKAALAMELFGKSGTQLLPLMSEGAKGIEAMQQQARDLGLTMSTEDARAAEALNDTFDTLWKVLKQGVFVIGSALAPALKSASEWIIQTVVTTTQWIKENKELVVTILKVAVGIVAGGLALMALGYAITTVGTILGAFAGIVAGVGTAIGILGQVIAWLVSPIGLAVAAIAALGAYLVYVSGAGGEALNWLGDRFADLSEFASESFQGIADALVAGDIALAAKILWLSLKVIWQKGVLELTRLWEWLKGGAMKIVYGLWYGVQAAWEIGVASVAEVMLKLYYGVMDIWESLSTGVMNVWDDCEDEYNTLLTFSDLSAYGVGAIVRQAGTDPIKCWTITETAPWSGSAVAFEVEDEFPDCDTCLKKQKYRLTQDCNLEECEGGGGGGGDEIITNEDLHAAVGMWVKVGGKCYSVATTDTGDVTDETLSYQGPFASCDACLESPVDAKKRFITDLVLDGTNLIAKTEEMVIKGGKIVGFCESDDITIEGTDCPDQGGT